MDPLIEQYLVYMDQSLARSEQTIARYSGVFARLEAALGETAIADATHDELIEFLGPELHGQGLTPRTRGIYVSAVRSLYKYLSRHRAIASDPSQAIPYPRHGRKLPKVMGLHTAERLLMGPNMDLFIGVRDAAMLSILIGCGPRVGGLCALNESDLMFYRDPGKGRQKEKPSIEQLTIRFTEKGGNERLVPAPADVVMFLRAFLGHPDLKRIDRLLPNGDRVLFPTLSNRNILAHEYHGEKRRMSRKAVWKMVQGYAKKMGLPPEECHPHAIRHLFGTELQESGVPLNEIQAMLGHANIETTQIYIHTADRRRRSHIQTGSPLSKIQTQVRPLVDQLSQ